VILSRRQPGLATYTARPDSCEMQGLPQQKCAMYGATLRIMSTRFVFDPEKALEALVYIVAKAKTDLYTSLKIVYSADKMHLHKYGRFVAGDFYKRLEHGPVPQGAYDILHFVRGEHSVSPVPQAREALAFTSNIDIKNLREPDLSVLSETDIECLDAAIKRERHKPFWQLKKDSHDAAYDATPENQQIAVEAIAGVATENREALLQYLADRYPDEQDC
jgi:hypothetical protein